MQIRELKGSLLYRRPPTERPQSASGAEGGIAPSGCIAALGRDGRGHHTNQA